MDNENNEILVSVAVRAYNMEKYIKECLDGILNQYCNLFSIEIVISTDCCNDNTSSIIMDYKKKHPHLLIRDVTSNQNLGGFNNLFYVISQCRGKYIALCDGDDFWIDNKKLKKQILFMEHHPEYSAIFHNARILYEKESNKTYDGIVENKEYTSNEITKSWIIPTSSFLFRSKFKDMFPEKQGFYFDDIVVFLTMAQFGKIRGSSDIMSVYRKTSQSWTEQMNKNKKIYDQLHQHYNSISKTFPLISKRIIYWLKVKNQVLKIISFRKKIVVLFKK